MRSHNMLFEERRKILGLSLKPTLPDSTAINLSQQDTQKETAEHHSKTRFVHSPIKHDVVPHLNCLTEAVLMRSYNMLYEERRKILGLSLKLALPVSTEINLSQQDTPKETAEHLPLPVSKLKILFKSKIFI